MRSIFVLPDGAIAKWDFSIKEGSSILVNFDYWSESKKIWVKEKSFSGHPYSLAKLFLHRHDSSLALDFLLDVLKSKEYFDRS